MQGARLICLVRPWEVGTFHASAAICTAETLFVRAALDPRNQCIHAGNLPVDGATLGADRACLITEEAGAIEAGLSEALLVDITLRGTDPSEVLSCRRAVLLLNSQRPALTASPSGTRVRRVRVAVLHYAL